MNRTLAWQRGLGALCALSFVLVATATVLTALFSARTGIIVERTDPAFIDHVLVDNGSPAYRAGLRNGDLIDRSRLEPGNRYRLVADTWSLGQRVNVPVERNAKLHWLTVVPERRQSSWHHWLAIPGIIWLLFFATIVSLRRADSREARVLAPLLIFFVFGSLLVPGNWISPWPALDAGLFCVSNAASSLGIALLATYALFFATPPSKTRYVATFLAYASAAASAIYGVVGVIGMWLGTIDPYGPAYAGVGVLLANNILPLALPLACAALAVADARGAERTRISWAAGPLAILYLGAIGADLLIVLNPAAGFALPGLIFSVCLFIAPLGLTYSLLSRRLLDIGFALNRAAVFAATTVLLAGLFSGLQWVVNATLSGLTHAHNILVQMTIAVIVYYVVRLSRAHTDAIVTSVFFARREQRINAIRELADAVDEVEDSNEIAAFVASYLRTKAAIDATVLLQADDGNYVAANGSLPKESSMRKDDITIVFLRSRRVPTRASDWIMPSALAFPMLIRGRMRGVLLCHSLEIDDEFAPDEISALFALASKMASARDDLLSESLRDELRSVQAENLALRQRLMLPTRA